MLSRPGEEKELTLTIGWGANRDEAQALVKKYREADIDSGLGEREETLGRHTRRPADKDARSGDGRPGQPLASLSDLGLPHLGRAGFYQAPALTVSAISCRTCMALRVRAPAIARAHILRAAGRQFVEGDVQHWWLPNSGRRRTRFSDDRLWLRLRRRALRRRHRRLGDPRREVPFLDGPSLQAGEHDAFFLPAISAQSRRRSTSIARARSTLARGRRARPAADRHRRLERRHEPRRREGNGESVWLGWFLHEALAAFRADAPERATDAAALRAGSCTRCVARRRWSHAWDGEWYRRAYFDDGFAARLRTNDECRIDSIAQSWSVISGARRPERPRARWRRVDKYLVDPTTRCCCCSRRHSTSTARSGLHQGLSARHARERRPIHARRAVDRHRVCHAGQRRPRAMDLFPCSTRSITRARAPRRSAIGSSLCRLCRRLFRRAERGPRRMDLVHGCRRLDVSHRCLSWHPLQRGTVVYLSRI